MTAPSAPDRTELANGRLDRITDWLDRIVPLRRLRPLDRVPSIKLKLSILIVAAIGITVATTTVGFWLDIGPLWSVSAAVVLALVLVQILARGLTSPLREMAGAADRMAAGELDQRVSATGSDEVGQLGRSFNEMAAHIADLERQRNDLIANVSHELRTPIAVLQGSVENLLDEVVEDQDDTLAAMLRQTRRLGRLVSQLMDLSRLEAGVAPMHMRRMDLVQVGERVIEEARLRDPEPKITLLAPHALHIHGDPERLHQVLANLLDNSIRYAPSNEPIELEIARSGDAATVVVRDLGPGIPDEELHRIFERFHRADTNRSTSTGGSGLGLAIAGGIVELHGGTISAANRSPTGCAMTVTLHGATD